jgi:SAM-dependent methyltransferase
MIIELLRPRAARTLLDVGCGSGQPLLRFLREGYDARGFDFSPRMVECARSAMRAAGQDPGRVSQGDIERPETLPPGPFDAIVATGVFPHNLDDTAAYANVRGLLAPHGVAYIEYRNALMALFSLNRHCAPFFWQDLLRADELPELLREDTRHFLASKFDTAVESVGKKRSIEYSDILARFHNPLTLAGELTGHGLRLMKVHYYHWHAAPPHLERAHRESFWRLSMAQERKEDWRAMFLCSACVAEIERS